MKLKRCFLIALMATASVFATAANRLQTVYLYGFAASFNDSTVFFTDIQQLDSAYIDSKTGFLYSRNEYSYQLRDLLASQGYDNATCITSFALNRKDAEKKYLELRKRYISGGRYTIKYIKQEDFTYLPIKPQETETVGGKQ